MERNFDEWLGNFRECISSYSYYVDFEKVYRNVSEMTVELNILNSLIGSKSIEDDFENLLLRYPEVLKCIPLLLAVRKREIFARDEEGETRFNFKLSRNSLDEYKMFMRKTGLFDLIENHIINNLVDYVTGVEVGLDSNGRKNRGGHLMEDLVESFILESGVQGNDNIGHRNKMGSRFICYLKQRQGRKTF